jgi:hypothetical protein
MKTQPKPAIRVAATALALSACGIAVGISGGASATDASLVSVRHAPGDTRFAELRDLAQVKQDIRWQAVEHDRARAGPRGVLGGTRPGLPPDPGLAACSSLWGAHHAAASDYPEIAAQFAASRWPDLRTSGLAYVEIATKLHSTHAYGGETVWFIQRLSAACAKHGWAGSIFASMQQLAQVTREMARRAGGQAHGG